MKIIYYIFLTYSVLHNVSYNAQPLSNKIETLNGDFPNYPRNLSHIQFNMNLN